ncbi:MAG: MBL fold metallo-hydrolase [Proteobacteria bacterium]|nr:MBL fold metallo-hydrolase [Pseudomonadota bacterium]
MIGLILAISSGHSQAACLDRHIKLQVLGSGGPELDDGRTSSSYLIWVDGNARVLVDAGGGSSANFEKSGASLDDLQAVLFTHFHVDHSGDFAAYIKASFFGSRTEDLPVFGPQGNDRMPSTDDFLATLLGKDGAYRYLSSYIETDQASDFHLIPHSVALNSKEARTFAVNNSLSVSAIPVHHGPIAAVAWRVDIDQCSISFSGDMNNQTGNLNRLAKGSQLLVAHNAIPQDSAGVARQLHMPPSEIGKIAGQAEVKKLLISHRMNRTLGKEQAVQTLAEIRKSYQGPVMFANDLDTFDIQ